MQYGSATQKPYRTKFFQLQRSAIEPVGIVAVVSMKTIIKKNSAITLTSSSPLRKNPFVPSRPYWKAPEPSPPIPMPSFRSANPLPSDGYQPGATGPFHQFPQPSANP